MVKFLLVLFRVDPLILCMEPCTGANHPMYGRTGANHHNYGKVPANALTINVYSIDNVLVRSFSSQVAAANWVNIPRSTFLWYLSSGKVWNNQYIFRKS